MLFISQVKATCYMGSKGNINLNGKTPTKARLRKQKHARKNQAVDVNAALGKVLSARIALMCLKETSSQDKEARIIIVFKIYSSRRASYDKTAQGRKYYHLTISFSPDNTTHTCNFSQNMSREAPMLGLRRNLF